MRPVASSEATQPRMRVEMPSRLCTQLKIGRRAWSEQHVKILVLSKTFLIYNQNIQIVLPENKNKLDFLLLPQAQNVNKKCTVKSPAAWIASREVKNTSPS